MSYRIFQVNELIKQELNKLLVTEIELPKNCLATINRIETSKDLRHAKVWLSVIPTAYTRKVLDKLSSRVGHLQFLLNKQLSMKPLPKLNFAIDDTEKKAQDIESILDRIKKTG